MENGDLEPPQPQTGSPLEVQPTYAEAFPPLSSMGTVATAPPPPVKQASHSAWPVRSIPQSTVTQVRACVSLYMYACVCVSNTTEFLYGSRLCTSHISDYVVSTKL